MSAFRLSFAGGATLRAHLKRHGDLRQAFAWERIKPPQAAAHRQWAAQAWLRSAFNEYHSATLMSEMVTKMIQAQVPLDLCTMASEFPGHELVHAELCARLSLAFGDADAINAVPPTFPAVEPTVSGLERCHQIVIRLCLVGESLSFGWLSSMARRGTQPTIKGVLRRLIKDEALHQAFGWMYLDWALDSLDQAARARLMRAVAEDMDRYLDLPPEEGTPPAPETIALYRQAGLLTRDEAATVGQRSQRGIMTSLAKRGLCSANDPDGAGEER